MLLETAKTDLGHIKKKSKSWIKVNSWKKIKERRLMKKKVNYAKSNRQEAQKKAGYQRLDKEVKSSLRNDKRKLPNNIAHAQEAEDAARQGQLTGVFKTTRK